MVGKDLEISVLLEMFFYAALSLVPMALPLMVDFITDGLILSGHRHPRKIARNGSRIVIDRHLIVVEHDDEIFCKLSRVRQRFESHAPRKRSVADNSDDLSAFVLNAS